MKQLTKLLPGTILLLFLGVVLIQGAGAQTMGDLARDAGDTKSYPGHDLLVVFDSTTVDMQETGLTYVTVHTLTKVLTSHGALDLNVVKYGYDPLSAFVEIRKAVIYRQDGSITELDVSKATDYPAPARAIYWGAREIMLETGRLEPGDAVEVVMFRKGFTYALLASGDDDKYIPPMRGQFYDIVEFFGSHPVKSKVYRVAVPAGKPLQYQFYNGEVQASCWFANGKMEYSFSKKDIMPLKTEPRMVAMVDVAPKLLVSTTPRWEDKSTWFFKVNEDFGSFESTPEIRAKVDTILKGAKNEMDSVSRLTHWCGDEIRYSGISMGCGEGFTLHKGEMTFTDRCGVCKDKAGMLITMLRAAGFESYPAMTMAGSRIDYIPADQFNHCVTVVKLRDGKYHLLDPTWVPFTRELWSSAEQQQNYLYGLPEGADLGLTPVSPPDNHYINIFGRSAIKDDGTLEAEVTIRAEGQSDGAIRRMFTGNYKDQWNSALEMELKRINPAAEMISVDYGDPYKYLEGPIEIVYKFRVPGFGLVNGDEMVVKSFIASGFFKRAMGHLYMDTKSETKVYPFRDRCSRQVSLTESITLPAKYQIVYSPTVEDFSDATASFEGAYEMSPEGNVLRMSQLANFNKRIYEAEEWPSFRKATQAQQKFIDEPVVLKRVIDGH